MANLRKKATEADILAATRLAEQQAEVELVIEKSPPIDAANLNQIADFPIDVLPDSIGKHIRLASDLHVAPADYLAIGYLATLATFTGALFEIESSLTCIGEDDNQQYGNLYFILIGDSSDGKSKALKEFMKPAQAIDKKMKAEYMQAVQKYRKDRRKFLTEVKKSPDIDEPTAPDLVMYYLNKCTTAGLLAQAEKNGRSGKPFCLFVDEMKGLLDKIKSGGHYADLLTLMIDFFQQNAITEIRKGSSIEGVQADHITYIPNNAMTFVGCIQKRALPALINEMTIALGYAPRLLYTSSKFDDRAYKRIDDAQAIKAIINYRKEWQQAVTELHYLCESNVQKAQTDQAYKTRIKLSSEAVTKHENFEFKHVGKMNSHRKANEPELREMIAKHREIILRLALNLHVGDWLPKAILGEKIPTEISAATFERAERLQQYFEQQALKALDKDIDTHPIDKIPSRIKDWYEGLPDSFTMPFLLNNKDQKAQNELAEIKAQATVYKWVARLRKLNLVELDRTGTYTKI